MAPVDCSPDSLLDIQPFDGLSIDYEAKVALCIFRLLDKQVVVSQKVNSNVLHDLQEYARVVVFEVSWGMSEEFLPEFYNSFQENFN